MDSSWYTFYNPSMKYIVEKKKRQVKTKDPYYIEHWANRPLYQMYYDDNPTYRYVAGKKLAMVLAVLIICAGMLIGRMILTVMMKDFTPYQAVTTEVFATMIAIPIAIVIAIAISTYLCLYKCRFNKELFTKMHYWKTMHRINKFLKEMERYKKNQIASNLMRNIRSLKKVLFENRNVIAMNPLFLNTLIGTVNSLDKESDYLNRNCQIRDVKCEMDEMLIDLADLNQKVLDAIDAYQKNCDIGNAITKKEENLRNRCKNCSSPKDLLCLNDMLSNDQHCVMLQKRTIDEHIRQIENEASILDYDFVLDVFEYTKSKHSANEECVFSWTIVNILKDFVDYIKMIRYCRSDAIRRNHMNSAKEIAKVVTDTVDNAVAAAKQFE